MRKASLKALALATALGAGLTLSACGDDESDTPDTTTSTTTTSSQAQTAPTAADLQTVLARAVDPNVPTDQKLDTVMGGQEAPELFDALTKASGDGPAEMDLSVNLPLYDTRAATLRGTLQLPGNNLRLLMRQPQPDARTVAVLEGVNDHENIGSIFRNAAGLGVDAVLFGAGCADPLYRRCVRVSMGHALLVPHARFDDWRGALDLLADHGFTTVALTPRESGVPLADAVSADKVAVLVGAEGPGLSETAIRGSHVAARIPMSRGTDSLNVATAAAIAFYERVRSGTIDR